MTMITGISLILFLVVTLIYNPLEKHLKLKISNMYNSYYAAAATKTLKSIMRCLRILQVVLMVSFATSI